MYTYRTFVRTTGLRNLLNIKYNIRLKVDSCRQSAGVVVSPGPTPCLALKLITSERAWVATIRIELHGG